MQNLFDTHVHSSFSFDSKASIDEMCETAISKGLTGIAFTEHFDMNPQDPGYQYFNAKAFNKAVEQTSKKYNGQIKILKGIEFGEPHLYRDQYFKVTAKDYDVIIGSVHCIGKDFVGEEKLLEQYSLEQIYDFYYRIMIQMVRSVNIDVIAHFDFPKRYFKKNYYVPAIDELILEVVKQKIALEINTSPLRSGCDEASPDAEIIEKYVYCGGELITIGSDAHNTEDIAQGFDYVMDLLKPYPDLKIGYFEKRAFQQLK